MKGYTPIAIDLGAKATGVWMSIYDEVVADPAAKVAGYAVQIDETAMTFMMPNRTAMRHMRRGVKRRKLAKALAMLWLADRWPVPQDEPQRRAIDACQNYLRGLMNRRGFTHFSLEEKLDPTLIDDCAESLEALGIPLGGLRPSDWVMAVTADPNDASHWLKEEVFSKMDRKANKKRQIAGSRELTDFVEAADVGDAKAAVKAINHLRDMLETARDAADSGHKPRAEYFQTIAADLERSAIGQQTCEMLQLSPSAISNLLGHIGNLNLRALRRYFHDPKKLTRKQLDVARFRAAWKSFFDRWSLVGETSNREEKFRRHLRRWREHLRTAIGRDDLWALLTSHDPAETIPPFEAQANRRPPKCQSLLLQPSSLDRDYPGTPLPAWRVWAQKLERADPVLGAGLDAIAAADAAAINRSSGENTSESVARWRASRVLQRALDRSRDLDPWKLRLLIARKRRAGDADVDAARVELSRALGEQHSSDFIAFATRYYDESRSARSGLWNRLDDTKRGLLDRCDVHPPHTKKVLSRLICNVLSLPHDASVPNLLRTVSETEHVDPPSGLLAARGARKRKLSSCLAKFADLQKNFGGDLRVLYQDALSEPASERNRWRRDESRTQAWNAYCWAVAVAECIGSSLGHSEAQIARYANPYSLAQLNQLLFNDRGGFASNCCGCLDENAWRAQLNADGVANASRLPADSVRPFDGMLARVLRAQATHIAEAIATDLQLPAEVDALAIPLLLEENRFEFTEQLASLKGTKGTKLKLVEASGERRRNEWQSRWQNKWQRIREAGHGHCPYCGGSIADDGDFDHIASQAGTRDIAGYAFDAEPNLIYAHKTCNARKGRAVYTLDNLHGNYLQAVFGTANRNAIAVDIESSLQAWLGDHTRRHRAFHQLPDDMQRALRHALFLPALRGQVLAQIANQNIARVNGTQRWFARELASALRDALTRTGVNVRLEFSVHRVPYADVGELRQRLAQQAPEVFEKPRPQPPFSHAVDAALVFAKASTDPKIRAQLGLLSNAGVDIAEFAEAGRAVALLPASLRVVNVARRPKFAAGVKAWHQPLFKAQSIGERFVPLGIDAEHRIWVGFGADNRFELLPPTLTKTGKPRQDRRAALLAALWPVLHTPEGMDTPDVSGLARLAANREDRTLWVKVDRRKAFDHMLASSRDPDDATTRALNSLRYTIQRADLAKEFKLDGTDKAPAAKDVLKDKDFCINVKFPGFRGVSGGTVTLPAKLAWQRLCADSAIAPYLDGETKLARARASGDVPEGKVAIDWDALMRRHFPLGSTDRIHRRKRTVHALPRLASASGGFRTRRVDPSGDPVYQLLQVDKGAYAGFAAKNNVLGFDAKAPQLLDVFARSGSLTPVEPIVPQQPVVTFDQRIPIRVAAESGITSMQLLPASSTRPAVRVLVDWTTLRRWIPTAALADSFRHQTATIDLTAADAKRLAAALQSATGIGNLGPRVNDGKASLTIERMDAISLTLFWGAGTGPGSKRGADESAEGTP